MSMKVPPKRSRDCEQKLAAAGPHGPASVADFSQAVVPDFGGRIATCAAEIHRNGLWGRTTTYKLIREGRLKTAKIGSKRIIFVSSIYGLLEEAARDAK